MSEKSFAVSRLRALFAAALIVASFAQGGEKNLRTLTHWSECLQKEQSLEVYVPSTKGPHSVLYLLHGAMGSYVDWSTRTDLKDVADNFNLLIVMPDGGPYGWYVDSPVDSTSRYESYIVKELVPFIDSAFNTYRNRKERGICGLSMGGFGALHLALSHPDVFSSASSLSGVVTLKYHPTQWHLSDVFGDIVKDSGNWRKVDLASELVPLSDSVAIKLDTGLGDFVLKENREFVQALQQHGFAFEYAEYPGAHTWFYWGAHLRGHLEFHSRNLLP